MTDPRPEAVDSRPDSAPAPDEPGAGGIRSHRSGHRAPRGPRKRRRRRSFWAEVPFLVVLAVVLALLLKTFLLQAFYIPSGSMERTLLVGDRVLVNKLVYDFRDPRRGEIVVFDGNDACAGTPAAGASPPCTWPSVREQTAAGSGLSGALRTVQGWVGLGSGSEHDFIKRVIAVGGDTVSCPRDPARTDDYCDHVVVDGVALQESSYLFEDDHEVFGPVRVPKGDLWVMGDHRGDSADSRTHGTIAVSSVVGRAFLTIWPFGQFGGHGVPSTFHQAGIDGS